MTRRYKRQYVEDDKFWDVVKGLVGLFILYLVSLYFTNRANFWRWLIYGVVFVLLLMTAVLGWRTMKIKRKRQHLTRIVENICSAGLEDYVKNFISRFGFEGRKGEGWKFRNHLFEWERISDLEKILLEKGVSLRHDEKRKDVYDVLRHYIQEKEEQLTRESVRTAPQKFSSLSGTDFEKLLYRLLEAVGYKVEWIGKSGDQGGDLIANKGGERILIQAKAYRDWSTGNAAVQQVVAAMKYYDCNKSMIISTSSEFTREAHALAKVNNTELIPKARLSEMLMQHLGENWG